MMAYLDLCMCELLLDVCLYNSVEIVELPSGAIVPEHTQLPTAPPLVHADCLMLQLDDFGIMLKRKGRQIGKDLFGRDPTDEAQVDKEIEDAANAVLSSALSAQAQTDTMTEPTGTSNDG
eukprot:m.116303 g.116303  ORF g.116303 m.116303 type:complete len:120 (-) comp13603_c0_seq1:208-567(-)